VLTLVLYALLAIAVAAAVFFVVASLLPAGEQIAPAIRDDRPWELPADQTIHAEQVASVRLPVALRGYRFAETDVLLDRLAEELRARDELIARLRGEHRPMPAESSPVADSSEPSEPDTSEDDGADAGGADGDAGPHAG
jgi:hypothetical protein